MNIMPLAPLPDSVPVRSDKIIELFQRHGKNSLTENAQECKIIFMAKPSGPGKLGPVVQYFCDDRKISPSKLASIIGVSRSAVSQIISGESGLSEATLEAILIALDVSPVTFFDKARDITEFAKPSKKTAKENKAI